MPGPSPQYQPILGAKELDYARRVLRQRKSRYAQAQRSRLAILLTENPRLPNPEVAKLLGFHQNTIRYWRKRWVHSGFQIEDKPRPGRPPVFSPEAGDGDQSGRLRSARPT